MDETKIPELNKKFTWKFIAKIEGPNLTILMCNKCGATVINHPDVDSSQVHMEWHEQNDPKEKKAK